MLNHNAHIITCERKLLHQALGISEVYYSQNETDN